jgi:V/A-type H+-transporting ATPase subunit B
LARSSSTPRSLSRREAAGSGQKDAQGPLASHERRHPLYSDAANAKTKLENGFDLTDYDNRCLDFAKEYADKLLAIDVDLDTTDMLDVTWRLFRKYFKLEEVNIKKNSRISIGLHNRSSLRRMAQEKQKVF